MAQSINNGTNIITSFENQVFQGFLNAGVSSLKNLRLGVAVSGGADSISLLTALSHIIPSDSTLVAITVNHNIRPEEETQGDADFVQNYCNSLGIKCVRFDIPRGNVELAQKRFQGGMEDAARRLRYECFETVLENEKLDFLCLAHNLNDQNETVLMRFFHGSGTGELAGIHSRRDNFLRPLLNIPRAFIEEYLNCLNVAYRTDKTNYDNAMYRNCIRNVIVPVLEKNIPGWQQGIASVAKKAGDDEEFIQKQVLKAMEECCWSVKESGVSMDANVFNSLAPALKRRILYRSISAVGCTSRMPYSFIERWMNVLDSGICEQCSGLEFSVTDAQLTIQKAKKIATQSVFFVIIQEAGEYTAGPWNIKVNSAESGIELQASSIFCPEETESIILNGLDFPFAIRNRQPGDSVRTAEGTYKSLSKILKDWKAEDLKDELVLVQNMKACNQDIVCIWGSLLKFKNWIVKK